MKQHATAVLFLLSLCLAQPPPPPPRISNTFIAETLTSVSTGSPDGGRTVLNGRGRREYDQGNNRAVTNVSLDVDKEKHVFERHFNLMRYDTGNQYQIIGLTNTTLVCKQTVVNGSMPEFFGWLEESTYNGSRVYRGRELQFWSSTVDGVGVEIGVDLTKDRNIPVVYYHRHESMDKVSEIYFTRFEPKEPMERAFEVPDLCKGRE